MSLSDRWKKDYPSVQDITEEGLDENTSLKKMLRLVGSNKRVIDFGCATGYFSQLLTRRGCRVTGVEINPEAAKVAELYCEQVIVADLDFISLTEILPIQEFDVAVFGDVLEHLRNPWRLLKETQHLLKSDGYVVASIPNIAHGAIRLALLQGRFEYTELGILDSTHLRFFTRKTVEELFKCSGYFIDIIDYTKLPFLSDSPFLPHIDKEQFNSEIWQLLENEEGIDDLQFIVRAFSSTQEGKNAALIEQYKIIDQLEQRHLQLQQTQVKLEQLQSQLQQTQIEKEQLQSQLQHTHVQLEQRHSQLQQSQAKLEQLQSQLQQTQTEKEQLQHTHGQLEQLHSQLQQTQTEKEQLQSQLQHTHGQLEQWHSQLQQTQTEKEQLQSQLQHTHCQLEQLHSQLQQDQAKLEQWQSQLQQTQTEKEQLQSQLQHTHGQLEQLHSQLQQDQAKLEQWQSQLQQTQTEKEQLQSQLQHTHGQLEQWQSQLQQTQIEKEQLQSQLQHTHGQLEQWQSQLQQTQNQKERSQFQLQQTQVELEQMRAEVSGMQASKFWKLRTAWFKLRRMIGVDIDR